MLKINLLPESERKAVQSPIEQLHRAPLLWVIAGGLVVVGLLCIMPVQVRRKQLRQLNAKIQALQPKKLEVDQLQQSLQRLRAQEAAFRKLRPVQGLWSERLNTLSNATPDGVWYTELNMDEEKGLIIQGSAIVKGGTEMAAVSRLVGDLKADPDFTSGMKDVQIESLKRVPEKDIELVQFTLTSVLLQDSTP